MFVAPLHRRRCGHIAKLCFFLFILCIAPILAVHLILRVNLFKGSSLYANVCTKPESAEYKESPYYENPVIKLWAKKYQLLLASDVRHGTPTIYLCIGYRPVKASVELCVRSQQIIHNKTVNISSHLIPAVIAVVGNCSLHLYFSGCLLSRSVGHTRLPKYVGHLLRHLFRVPNPELQFGGLL